HAVVEDVEGVIPCAELIGAYDTRARETGHPTASATQFGSTLALRYPQVRRLQRTVASGKVAAWCYVGLAWRPEPPRRGPPTPPTHPSSTNCFTDAEPGPEPPPPTSEGQSHAKDSATERGADPAPKQKTVIELGGVGGVGGVGASGEAPAKRRGKPRKKQS